MMDAYKCANVDEKFQNMKCNADDHNILSKIGQEYNVRHC